MTSRQEKRRQIKISRQKDLHNFELLDGAITNLIQEVNHVIESAENPKNFEEWSDAFFQYTNLVLGRYSQYVLTFAEHIRDVHIDHSTGEYLGGTCDETDDSKRNFRIISRNKEMTTLASNNRILVDIVIADLTIMAALPAARFQQSYMPLNETQRIIWFETVDPERLNRRQFGQLKGKALKRAQKIVDSGAGIGMSAELGSIEIDFNDFIPMSNGEE